MTKRNSTGLILIISIAFILRIFWIISIDNQQMSDFADYNRLADNIIKNKTYTNKDNHPSAFRPPGMPFLMAIVYSLAGRNEFNIKVFLATISSFLCLLIFFVGRKVTNVSTAMAATAIAAFFPDFIFSTTIFNSELPFTVLITAAVLILSYDTDLLRNTTPVPFIVSGILFGIAALFRPIALAAPAGVFIMCLGSRLSAGETLIKTTVFTISLILTIAPWTYRNYTVFNRMVPVSTNGGCNLIIGNNPDGSVVWVNEEKLLTNENMPSKKKWQSLNECEKSDIFKDTALDYIKEYPQGVLLRIPRKIYLLLIAPDVPWLYWNIEGQKNKIKMQAELFSLLAAVNRLFWYILLVLAVISIFRIRDFKDNTAVLLSGTLLFLGLLVHLIFWGKARFRFPACPFLIVMAANSCYYFSQMFSRKRKEV